MSILHFSDILEKAGLDPAKVKLIRHSLGDKDFSKCYYSEPQMVWEYTRIQKPGFSKTLHTGLTENNARVICSTLRGMDKMRKFEYKYNKQ